MRLQTIQLFLSTVYKFLVKNNQKPIQILQVYFATISLNHLVSIKDARSVFLYPYKRSQILQYVKYTKWIKIAKEIAKCCDKKSVFAKKVKTQQQQNKNQTLAGAGNWTRDLSNQNGMRQLRVTIVVKLFNCFNEMGQNVNKQSQIWRPHIFNKFIFSVILLHAWITIFGCFSYLWE